MAKIPNPNPNGQEYSGIKLMGFTLVKILLPHLTARQVFSLMWLLTLVQGVGLGGHAYFD